MDYNRRAARYLPCADIVMESLPPEALSADEARPSYRWAMLALVWLVYVCFGMTSTSVAPLVNAISQDLEINSSQMGLVLGAWQLVYIGLAYSLGTLVDRLGVRRALAMGSALVALSLLLRATAVDFISLFFVVALLGVGGPFLSIGAPKAVAIWFRGREQAVAVGLYATAPTIGGIVVLAATNSLVVPLTGHWRLAFVVYGVAASLATITWWLLARDRSPASTVSTAHEVPSPGLSGLFRIPNVRVVLFLVFAVFLLNHGLTNWLPTVLTDKGIGAASAGIMAAVPSFVGILALLLISGVVRHGYRGRAIALLMLVGAGSTVAIAQFEGGGLAAALVFSGLSRYALMPMLTLVLIETPGIGALRIGAAGGIFFAVGEIGGFAGPLLMGVLRDLTDTLSSGLILIALITAAVMPLALVISERRHRAGL